MRVTFVLPAYAARPVGGIKVVYEYANGLSARGHSVNVVHPRGVDPPTERLERLKARLWPYRMPLRQRPLVPWFPLRKDVRVLLTPDLRASFVPAADAIFATAWHTASWINAYPSSRGKKFYLIQHYEAWSGAAEHIDASWRLPLHKVVIARWLLEKSQAFGEAARTTYIPNGIDAREFSAMVPIEARKADRVGMLYHEYTWKGTQIGLRALATVRERMPNLEAVLFGVVPRPSWLPVWVDYVEDPSSRRLIELYNSCAVFVSPSLSEGWPLPPAEAMACGCAVVAAANPGVMEYASDGVTALLAPTNDCETLADRIARAISDDALRLRIARSGREQIRHFTWQTAVDRLEELLIRHVYG